MLLGLKPQETTNQVARTQDHVFVIKDPNLIINAGADDVLRFTTASFQNCKACFGVYPSRDYFSVQAVTLLSPEPLASSLPTVEHPVVSVCKARV